MNIKPVDSKTVSGSKHFSTKTVEEARNSFESALKNSTADQKKEVCSMLLQKIDSESKELKKRLTPEGIKRYAELVRAFMKEALGQSYALGEETHWDRSGNRKNFVLVKQINQSLEELIESVIKQERSQLDLVGRLDEIRGLLVDLYW